MACDDKCGCPVPCPGGATCRCTSTGTTARDETSMEHNKCACGAHCGCNPCTCNERVASQDDCRCGAGCACLTCSG